MTGGLGGGRRKSLAALGIGIALVAASDTPHVVLVKDYPGEPVPTAIRFQSLEIKFGSGQVQLANGDTVDPAQWPAIVVATLSKTSFCSATIIGPSVLLTAAHCVDARNKLIPDATIPVSVEVGNLDLQSIECKMHQNYAAAPIPARKADPRSADDFALCELNGKMPKSLTMETLELEASLTKQEPVVLIGYGCTSAWVIGNSIEHGPSDEALRIGDSNLHAVNVADTLVDAGTYVATRSETKSQPYICPGDSGGPMMTHTSVEDTLQNDRRIAGVNSKLVALAHDGHWDFYSLIAPSNQAGLGSFLTAWQDSPVRAARKVCGKGIKPGDDNCRG